MPIVKLSLTEEEFLCLSQLSEKEHLTKQDMIRFKLFGAKPSAVFTPEEAHRRALEKFTEQDEPFTLPDIYGEEWRKLNPRMTGVFGKRFFNYLKESDSIEFVGMTSDGRRALYRIKKG